MGNDKRILVTAALPYANGEIHLGHILEYLQADIWTRFQKLNGRNCRYFCADDTHGTPIMVNAQKQGITPEQLINNAYEKHVKDFQDFGIEFDHFDSTNSAENRQLAEEIFAALKQKGHISSQSIEQAYCEHDKMFLPDRFVKGICPKCGTQDQYGDSCDACSATYSTADLKSPYCTICKNTPVTRSSEHLFFQLSHFQEFLSQWVKEHTQTEVYNKLKEWLNDGLRPWDISRDEPYFGFEIPGHPKKYFYVWVDAPIGYISSTKNWCTKNNQNLEDWWKSDDCKIYHFIGKDIVYFHTLFWPAMLNASGYSTPEQVYVHGFVKINGEKMSKSKGTFINARTYLNHLDPMYLRYYYASKLSPNVEDLDLNFHDFVSRVNSELVGKISNLASRGAQMLSKRIDGKMGELKGDGLNLVQHAQQLASVIGQYYENREYQKAINSIRDLADEANRYFDQKEPWNLIKEQPEATRDVLTAILNSFRLIALYLKPVIPQYVKQVETLLNIPPLVWEDAKNILVNHKIGEFQHLAQRIEIQSLQAIVEDEKKMVLNEQSSNPVIAKQDSAATIEFDDFMKVDLRVAKIIAAEVIEKADKLLKLTVDVGELGNKQVIAGIRSHYQPEELLGRLTVIVSNLAPRKMKFGMSEAMVLAAGGNGGLYILSPDSGARPGQRIK